MICLRCGYCCQNCAVVLPDGNTHLGGGEDCKFLIWDGDDAVCTVHGQDSVIEFDGKMIVTPWEETPCGRHGQIEQGNQPCRMGVHRRER